MRVRDAGGMEAAVSSFSGGWCVVTCSDSETTYVWVTLRMIFDL